MHVESPESLGLEEQRAELKAVLDAREFQRAPTLANLLSYLCEKLFAGDSGQIKEYSIGVEVFHRGPEFDQDSDSIVRVEANRLRKRLADYYAGDGATHRLQITIPVGQYVPRFAVARTEEAPGANQTIATGPNRADSSRRSLPFRWWLTAALGMMLAGLALGWLLTRHTQPPNATAPPETAAPQREAQFGPPIGEEVRILAGSNRSLVDHAGKLWNEDAWFTGGTAVKSAVQHIWRTQDPSFYRTSRQGRFRYDIPLKKGIYELRLHFAETFYGPESSATGGEGSRIFSVRANGKPLLTDFDAVADAGGSRTADVKVFPDMAPATDGALHLEFAGENGNDAMLSAIEILPGLRGRIRPVRVLTRQTPYYSNDSNWWSPDNYFQGGQMATYPTPVNGTDDPELFESERWGNFSYAIPVSPGHYTLTLYFTARHDGWDEPPSPADENREPVAHIFNVYCNGKILLQNFDLPSEARNGDAVIRRFTGLEPSAQGKLLLSFVPVSGYASVTGIEVLAQ